MNVDNIEWLCLTCNNYLKKDKIPPCAIANGLNFPVKPDFFDLNELECRLVAPRLAFQKIMQAPRGGQLKITGNVVNVPADVCNTIHMLPRLSEDTGTIKVQLKRRLQYKSSALSLNGARITFDADWIANFNPVISNEDKENENKTSVDQTNSVSSDEEWSVEEAEIPAGVTDSMLLTSPDFVDDDERQHIYNVAPAEGGRPISLFRDQFSEEMAYPRIFWGQKRPDNNQRLKTVYYSEICKSELGRSHRRAAMCIENIFFKAKKLQMNYCLDNRRTLNAGQLKTPEGLESLIRHDEGYKFLRALRGSPPYFEKAKKDLFATIRQLGPASLFCSFSSAETKWNHLLRILGKLIDHKDYSDKELDNLTWDEKCRLIQSDPTNSQAFSHVPKKAQKICRFNYPQPPMRSTQILYPLDDDTSRTVIRSRKDVWKDIKNKLNDLKKGEDMTFDQLLKDLDVSEHDYILAIRSSINCPTIFLKRSPNELRINNYNPVCLQAWRANMDIQFVLDVYACAMHIVSYISKAQKGMSELLRKVCAEAKQGNSSIKQQVRDIGNKFLNSIEISAQEAVYIILQLPMRKCSRNVVFVNTFPSCDRVELLKPLCEIAKMSDESEEIHSGGLLQ
ncbi:Hypothetical predicted protein [Paramuricea clavata]|uniref:Uncharacterized protein n=1 Tax=Paramuricea clavata TaxID=317549 RepID=A0A7D9IS72_PARCT|nr:Hypothetical predicted protein [Paramuricea clavata]